MNYGEDDPTKQRVRLSIGLPVFNGGDYLDDAIRSIRSQTFEDFELIIADNASSDDSVAIGLRHAQHDDRIRVLTSSKNHGASWNFNRTVSAASGQFFKWAAHDDLLEPKFLEECMAPLERDDSVVLSSSAALDIDESGQTVHSLKPACYLNTSCITDRVSLFFTTDTDCTEVFGIMRRDTLLDTRMMGAYPSADRVLLLEFALRGMVVQAPEFLLRRRQHDSRSARLTANERANWFSSDEPLGANYPKWRLLREYTRAIVAAPISRSTKARLCPLLVQWSVRYRRTLIRELVSGTTRPLRQIGTRRE